ncbi:triose-phosphate isomerase [Citromicrobium bathyomarinum]|uniref:triose-phosphate isomerase n=1 Tax=Citromicrobium bathyomarinum TaxID=72174 RepID=UPI00315AE384
MASRPFIVGNWKMHGTRAMLSEARAIDRAAQRLMQVEIALAPPFTLIHPVRREAEQIGVGAQDCHPADGGAHTGDISAAMVADAGAGFVILGHSERREGHNEKDKLIAEKAAAAFDAGLKVILCCGEPMEKREAGKAVDHVLRQLKASLPDNVPEAGERLTVAYEPIWAIGSGEAASIEDIVAMHSAIREFLVKTFGEEDGTAIRIIYGGSVNPENAAEIIAGDEVNGALVGGASLSAESFMNIVLAAQDVIASQS